MEALKKSMYSGVTVLKISCLLFRLRLNLTLSFFCVNVYSEATKEDINKR